MNGRDYTVLLLALGLGMLLGSAFEAVRPLSLYGSLLHALGSGTSGTLVRLAGFGTALASIREVFDNRL